MEFLLILYEWRHPIALKVSRYAEPELAKGPARRIGVAAALSRGVTLIT
jgi:hypothetical protein